MWQVMQYFNLNSYPLYSANLVYYSITSSNSYGRKNPGSSNIKFNQETMVINYMTKLTIERISPFTSFFKFYKINKAKNIKDPRKNKYEKAN